ncbi:hypothetical protein CA13_72210 [Planctomycetes bacterium CA13]|uniref:DUF4332 domain-containing protein n=1 Tax=Novipirellula herctigrandis TaxID=2527986 RepID=A0A5C5YPD1_9BACT|nr:hypothetical protein CA13_72210 [Planctomycetes bacterium CA13]
MLRTFLRLISRSHQAPVPVDLHSPDHVVLFAHLNRPLVNRPSQTPTLRQSVPSASSAETPSIGVPTRNHREWMLSQQLDHMKLFPEARCQQLCDMGITTAGDLVTVDLKSLATKFNSPKKSIRILKRYRQAIRFAATVPGMMPRDAMLLISIHRRSIRGLAVESPIMLYRDLQRFAESSSGRKLLRGRRLPSIKRIRRWISTCERRIAPRIYPTVDAHVATQCFAAAKAA